MELGKHSVKSGRPGKGKKRESPSGCGRVDESHIGKEGGARRRDSVDAWDEHAFHSR